MAQEPALTRDTLDPEAFSQALVALLEARFHLAPPIAEPVLYLLEHPGKGLRPELCYAVADACGGGSEAGLMSVAAAGELLHLAALIHDDLVDEAERRRGLVAVHRRFDARTAVLAGDYMVGAAFAVVSADAGEATLRRLGPALHALAEAELLEMRARGHAVDVDLARRIAQGKAGSLFAWIATGAAIECREWAGEAAWHRWGLDLGLLYQLADDLGDELAIDEGKDTGRDAATGTPTIVGALLAGDASGDAVAWELERLTYQVTRPPAWGPRLGAFTDRITDRAHERFELWMDRRAGGAA